MGGGKTMNSFKLGELVKGVEAGYRSFEIVGRDGDVFFVFGRNISRIAPIFLGVYDVESIVKVEIMSVRTMKRVVLYFSGAWKTEFTMRLELLDGVYVKQGGKFVLQEGGR
jgi:hypothetical protein